MPDEPNDTREPAVVLTLALADEAATASLAAALAAALRGGEVVHLSGELGAGKTTFVRAVLRSLGYNGRVRSPSFTLLEPYNLTRFDVYHFDFYRFSSDSELRDAGFEELLDGRAVAFVEWPEMASAVLPVPDLRVRLARADDGESRRQAQLVADSARGRACLSAIAASMAAH